MKVRYSYLGEQFSDCDDLWDDLKKFVASGDFTLGSKLQEFESNFADLIGVKYAIGVGSGTDALKISLKAAGVTAGDEVITSSNTFVATVGAINELGAIPVFVDVKKDSCIDTDLIEYKISEKTRAIIPVHFTGNVCDMDSIMAISKRYNLKVVEDACQAILGKWNGLNAGSIGDLGAFSLHPLKNINIWSDGGLITTNDETYAYQARLLRNHGLVDRDTVLKLGFNSRLDTFQAVVGNWLLPKAEDIAEMRKSNARYLDDGLGGTQQIQLPQRNELSSGVFHIYWVLAENRNALYEYCLERGIEVKIHYPTPIYRQDACKMFSFGEEFPIADYLASNSISFPCDQHLRKEQLDYIIKVVREFYS